MTCYQKNRHFVFVLAVFLSFCLAATDQNIGHAEVKKMNPSPESRIVELPPPALRWKTSLEETLKKRESVRNFSSRSLDSKELSQLLWAAQGVTRKWGARTAPSAGGLFPLEIYVATKDGVFHYLPQKHHLVRTIEQDLRNALAQAALGQDCIREAPAVFVIAAVYERMAGKYGSRAERYVKMEVGHASQNILLQAVAMGMGAVPVGAFYDEQVKNVLQLPRSHDPLYLISVGFPR